MHFILVLTALGIAACLRWTQPRSRGSWIERWQRALVLFSLPPLLLLTTAVAIVCMGAQGQMLGLQASWWSYFLAVGFLVWTGINWLRRVDRDWRARRQICQYDWQDVEGTPARAIDTELPYTAWVGGWQPELVVTRGLLDLLDSPHLQAVLAHERAHYDSRDPFWFFWLGWLRSCTAWLPHTEALWQELLLLRELRADRHATRHVDPLLLAESLLEVARAPLTLPEHLYVPLSCSAPPNRLQERIDALLGEPELPSESPQWRWSCMSLALLPLATVLLHH